MHFIVAVACFIRIASHFFRWRYSVH